MRLARDLSCKEAAMPQPTQAERLEHLERKMADHEFQFLQFRDEVRVEFSAVRAEMRQLATRNEMQQLIAGTTDEMRQLIVETNDETRHLMRVLHEDVISRFAVLEERWNGRSGPAASRRRLRKKR
jgi:uncharacterized UPF0160 family protein